MITQKEKILIVAQKLLSHTNSNHLRRELKSFIDYFDCIYNKEKFYDNKNHQNMLRAIEHIANDGYDITGFGLSEIPTVCAYYFTSEVKGLTFAVYLDDACTKEGDISFGFIDNGILSYTKNIENAVNQKVRFEYPNPTETEKQMYRHYGLYPIISEPGKLGYCRYVIFYTETSEREDFPREIYINRKNIDYTNSITFHSDAELVKVDMYADVELLSLIVERIAELGWERKLTTKEK